LWRIRYNEEIGKTGRLARSGPVGWWQPIVLASTDRVKNHEELVRSHRNNYLLAEGD